MAAFLFSQGFKNLISPYKNTDLFRKPAAKPATSLFTPAPNFTPDPRRFGVAPTTAQPANASTIYGPRFFASPVLPQVKVPPTAPRPIFATPRPAFAPPPPATAAPPEPFSPPSRPEVPQAESTPQPAPFTPTPAQQAAISSAEEAYQKSLQLSPEELSTQEDLDKVMGDIIRIRESFRKGALNVQDQPVAMEFITGQLASMERRALAQAGAVASMAEPLERKLARLQAARTSSTEASKFALERAGKAIEGARGEAKDVRTEAESARRFGIEQAGSRAGRDIQREGILYQRESLAQTKAISDRQFEEDKRKFGLDYAIKQREIAVKELEARKETGPSTYQQERTSRVIQSVNELLPRVSNRTVGVGSYVGFIRGTEAKDFAADVETLKANISFSELQAMRQASKTGGALGQIAVRELELLESTLGALDVGQRPENFRKNLQKIKDSLDRWSQASGGTGNVYKAPSGNTYNLPY